MSNIDQILSDICELKNHKNDLSDKTKEKSKLIKEKIQELRERIINGETTGDRIKDFVLAVNGPSSERYEAVYRNLEAKISQHIGEFVLVVEKVEKRHVFRSIGEPQDSDYIVEEWLRLGIIRKDRLELDLENGRCEFLTGNYASCQDALRNEVKLDDKNIRIHHVEVNLNDRLKPRNPMSTLEKEPHLRLEILVGDNEVKAWFERRCRGHFPFIVRHDGYLITFNKAARLLGRPIEKDPQISKKLQPLRDPVMKKLIWLILERDRIKEDENLTQLGRDQKIGEIEDKIKKQVKKALDLDVKDLQISLPSIRQLCQEYKIKET